MNIIGLLNITLLACMWGTSYLFIKISVAEIPPLTLTFLRMFIATITLIVIIKIRKVKLQKPDLVWKHLAIMSCFTCIIPSTLMSLGEQVATSSSAAIVNGLSPIFTAIGAHLFIPNERLSSMRIIGIIIGLTGLLFLTIPPVFGENIFATPFSLFLFCLATISFSVGFIYGRYFIHNLTNLMVPTMQFFIGSVLILPFALIFDQPWKLSIPSLTAWLSVIAYATWGTALAYIIYFRILHNDGPVALSMVTYLLPAIAILLGVTLLKEVLGWYVYFACASILMSMIIVNGNLTFKTGYVRSVLKR